MHCDVEDGDPVLLVVVMMKMMMKMMTIMMRHPVDVHHSFIIDGFEMPKFAQELSLNSRMWQKWRRQFVLSAVGCVQVVCKYFDVFVQNELYLQLEVKGSWKIFQDPKVPRDPGASWRILEDLEGS